MADIAAFIIDCGAEIVGLGLNMPPFSSSAEEIRLAAGTDESAVFYGRSFSSEAAERRLAAKEPDIGVCCGFNAILPKSALALPRWGWVNVHRSYLPYNRGLEPLLWAVLDGTPVGVSLHVMTEQVDAGPVIAQVEVPVLPDDGLDELSQRVDGYAFALFERAWPRLRRGDLEGREQDEDLATYHTRRDCEALRRLDLDGTVGVRRLLAILRLSSRRSDVSDVYFDLGPQRYYVHTRVIAGRGSGAP